MKFVLTVLLALAFPFSAVAEEVPLGGMQCLAKDQVIEANIAEGVKFRKINDELAAVLTAELKAQNVLSGTSYVVFWMEREDAVKAVVAVFDEHNCYAGKVVGPRDRILALISGTGA